MSDNRRVLVVVYTERGQRIRLVGARQATHVDVPADTQLPPDVVTAAQGRGRARDLWATVEELFDEEVLT